jgi:RHS repeat-associated protein
MSYAAFGERRDPTTWTGPESPAAIENDRDQTYRGYTGQEELDAVGLIHMNGRVYDPTIGRFTSADPTNGSGLNRYAYAGNNPLTFTDPSGYCFLGCFLQPDAPAHILGSQSNSTDFLLTGLPSAAWKAGDRAQHNKYVRLAGAIIAAYYTGGASLAYFGGGFGGSVASGAVAGATFSGSYVASGGGSTSQILHAGFRGALGGAVGAGFLYGANFFSSGWGMVGQTVAHGAAGGLTAASLGGDFKKGFALSAVAFLSYTLYQSNVNGEAPRWGSGGKVVYKKRGNPGAITQANNNFGGANIRDLQHPLGSMVTHPSAGFLGEGNPLTVALDRFPGFNAVSSLHDVWQGMYEQALSLHTYAPQWYNIGTMLPAAGVTYTGLVNTSIGSGIIAGHVYYEDGP